MGSSDEKHIEEVLCFPIMLSERVRQTVEEAVWFKLECSEVGKQAESLCQMLRSAVRLAASIGPLYECPLRRIVAVVSINLDRALALVRKCKRRSVLRRVVTIVTFADFRKVTSLLDASIGDMKWLLSIFDHESIIAGGIVLSMPPIASIDPVLSWVWSFIATIHFGQLSDQVEAANELGSLALDNNRNKKIIVDEGGVPPLFKLLKESASPDAQLAAATVFFHLANDQDRVRLIADEMVPLLVQLLGDSPMRVQIEVANLVGRMAEHDAVVQEEFARENIIRPLVTLLSFETFEGDLELQYATRTIHPILQISKEMERSSLMSFNSWKHSKSSSFHLGCSSRVVQYRKERENEKPEVKHKLKISCAWALWMLARGSVSNSRRITETKGLLCLAKLIEDKHGELQFNCLMTVMEVAAAAKSNADLRRAAFKANSSAAKAIVDQLLRITKQFDSPSLQIPAIKSIGLLARTFPARETRVIGPLVEQLSHWNHDVATEASISLGNFACPENFLCMEHSKTIIEFNGVPSLMRILRGNEKTQLHGLILLCYLALHAGNSEALEQARVLTALEGVDRTFSSQHPKLRELIHMAISHLTLYRADVLPQRQAYF